MVRELKVCREDGCSESFKGSVKRCQHELKEHDSSPPGCDISPEHYSTPDADFTPERDDSAVYVVELSDGKWYVGMSKNIEKRMAQHKRGDGHPWTRNHDIINFHIVEEGLPRLDARRREQNIAENMVSAFGPDSVRGGTYTGVP
jgi:predicted GIY-YIG superfamily endonuclease